MDRRPDRPPCQVVQRAQALLDDPRIQQTGIQHTFKPGWQWIYSYNQIIQHGKRLKAQLDATEQQPAPVL